MKVGVVGAGITGLSLSHYLGEHGVDVSVFETDDEPGGVIKSRRAEGVVLEHGPQRLRLTPKLQSLIKELGLGDKVVEADRKPLYIYAGGSLRRVPLSISSAVTTDLLDWRDKLRILLEPFTSPPEPRESVESLITRKLGERAYTDFVAPLYGGIYASDPAEMPIKHSLLELLEEWGVGRSLLIQLAKEGLRRAWNGSGATPIATFEDGLQTLPQSLYRANQENVYLNLPVKKVEKHRDGYILIHDEGETRVNEAVLTTPAYVTADLVRELDRESAESLSKLNYNSIVVVYLRGECGLEGMGYQTSFRESHRTLGVTWNSSLFPEICDGLYTCYFGGMRDPGALDVGDKELMQTAEKEFKEATGCTANAIGINRLINAIPAYDSSWSHLDGVDTPLGIHLCANYTGRAGIPARVRAAEDLAETLR